MRAETDLEGEKTVMVKNTLVDERKDARLCGDVPNM